MAEVQGEEEDDEKELHDARRLKAPNKKKFEEDMDVLGSNIRAKEQELEASKAAGMVNTAEQLKNLKTEKNASIEHRKKIDVDLQKLNKDISEMMCNLSRLESTLHYRNEDKINEAINRLEWNMRVQNFKLSEEKKIVAEIDSLRRSKKTLALYLSLKKDMERMRDRQRHMREERDHCFHSVTQFKQQEEKVRSDAVKNRTQTEKLKKEVDSLYEAKRQMIATYKKQREEYNDMRDRQRHESFKKREEEKRAVQARLKQELEELEAQRRPFEEQICLCNTLIHYLNRFVSNTDADGASLPASTTTPASSPAVEEAVPLNNQASGPVEELEDGQYVLLRKSDESSYISCSSKHSARKQRRSRKASMVKRITHTPEVLSQFSSLSLHAPTTMAEVLASLEQLRARKLHYEREADVKSETESAVHEMSRQASHTESSDGLSEARPVDHVMEELLQLNGCCHDPEPACSLRYEGAARSVLACEDGARTDHYRCHSDHEQQVSLDECSFPSLLETVTDGWKGNRGSAPKRPTSMTMREGVCGGMEMNGLGGTVQRCHSGFQGNGAVASSSSKAAWDTVAQGMQLKRNVSASPVINGVVKCDDVQDTGNGFAWVQLQATGQNNRSDWSSASQWGSTGVLESETLDRDRSSCYQMAEHICWDSSQTVGPTPITPTSSSSDFSASIQDVAKVALGPCNESGLCAALGNFCLSGDSMFQKEASLDSSNKHKDAGILTWSFPAPKGASSSS